MKKYNLLNAIHVEFNIDGSNSKTEFEITDIMIDNSLYYSYTIESHTTYQIAAIATIYNEHGSYYDYSTRPAKTSVPTYKLLTGELYFDEFDLPRIKFTHCNSKVDKSKINVIKTDIFDNIDETVAMAETDINEALKLIPITQLTNEIQKHLKYREEDY